ncbi:MAG: cobalt-precorrin-6A reductase [Hyphomicrobium sp.]
MSLPRAMAEDNKKPMRVLLLGGTSEGNVLAAMLARDARFQPLLSLAGRTAAPKLPDVPLLSGGFGGGDALAAFIASQAIDLVIDATHPFAVQMSSNAVSACRASGAPLIALDRPAWEAQAGDRWRRFQGVVPAIAALPETPTRVFSALGRQSVALLAAAPRHRYVIRVVDAIAPPPDLPDSIVIAARGPFRTEDDEALFRTHGIEIVLAKNAGGPAAISKIEAARALGLTVFMVDRPAAPERPVVRSVDDAWRALLRHHASSADRGV